MLGTEHLLNRQAQDRDTTRVYRGLGRYFHNNVPGFGTLDVRKGQIIELPVWVAAWIEATAATAPFLEAIDEETSQ